MVPLASTYCMKKARRALSEWLSLERCKVRPVKATASPALRIAGTPSPSTGTSRCHESSLFWPGGRLPVAPARRRTHALLAVWQNAVEVAARHHPDAAVV